MKAIEYVKNHSEYDVGYLLRDAFNAGFIAAKFEAQINAFAERCPDKELQIEGDKIQLCRPDQQTKLAFLEVFGGEWKKEVETYDKTKLEYRQEVMCGERQILLVVSFAEPPPSCQIVEEEVLIPAMPEHTEKRKVIRCKPNVEHSEEALVPQPESEAQNA